ncbi:translocator protein-like [Aedes albopictus]|uniref:Peripheral-type benzodiazepine receptor n=1 Tax=Aedes albopictus TaxID=7160 RepID=A0ABM1XJQ6_AEDAL
MVQWKSALIILFAVLTPLAGGFLASLKTRNAIRTWYTTLVLPPWRPPNWLFAPAWTFLYLSMGYASYIVWRDGNGFSGPARWPLVMYILQLLMNWAWPPVFFIAHELKWSAVLITLMLLMVIITTITFYKVNRLAGWLMIPYIVWLAYATSLNWKIYTDNS